MNIIQRIAAAVLVAGCTMPGAGVARLEAAQQADPAETAAVAAFSQRVQDYALMHRRLEGPVPTPKVSEHMEEVKAAMDALAAKIKQEPGWVKQGRYFTPEIVPIMRRLIREGCGGDFASLLAIIKEENPVDVPLPPVGARWPREAAHSMIPPAVLCRLPVLPEELQYRFIGPHLLLWDIHADLIVDVLPDAIPTAQAVAAAGAVRYHSIVRRSPSSNDTIGW